MSENFRAWFLRTKGWTFPGPAAPDGALTTRALDAVAEYCDHVTEHLRLPAPRPPEVQVCHVENHVTPGRGSDLRVIADDSDAAGDRSLAWWVEERLGVTNGNVPKEAAGEVLTAESPSAPTRMFVIACRHHAFYVIGPFRDREAVDAWAYHERQNGDDPRWQLVEFPSKYPWPDSQFPAPVHLSASEHPPRD